MANGRAAARQVKSLLTRAGHFYFIRIILVSMVLGIVLVAAKHAGFTLPNVFLLLFGLAYPHACRLFVGELEGQNRRGHINLLVDGFYAGAVMPALGFATLPCLVLFVINLFNWMAIGGPLLTGLGGLVMLIGLVISGTFSRYAHSVDFQDPTLDLLAYSLLLAYFFLVSLVVYRYASALQRRCIELQAQKNAAEIGNRRAERALLAVLPPSPARLLQTQGSIAPTRIADATLLLADFGHAALGTLAESFHTCDEIFARHGLERVKTSNRRYLAIATGEAAADAALAAAEELQIYFKDHALAGDASVDDIRICMHCGPVEAGLVQAEQFNYDAVGDAVDTLHSLAHRQWPAGTTILLTAAARACLHGQHALSNMAAAGEAPIYTPLPAATPA